MQEPMPQDDMPMPMGGADMMDNNNNQSPMAPGNQEMPPMGGDMNNQPMPQDNGGSDYDTDFDAGVEADEDTDPKKYIQQLTGKLSTTLNSYNSENGDDDGLNKYVAKMIVKASTKNMDERGKKDVIKAINTSSNEEPEEDNEPANDEEMNMEQEPIQERCFKKKDIFKHYKR